MLVEVVIKTDIFVSTSIFVETIELAKSSCVIIFGIENVE